MAPRFWRLALRIPTTPTSRWSRTGGRTDDGAAAALGERLRAGCLEPLPHRHVVARVLPGVELGADLAHEPRALRDDGVAVDRLEVLLASAHEGVLAERRIRLDDAADHLPHAVLDEPWVRVGLLDHGELVRALHQLVDLRAHRLLDDAQQVW